MIHDGSWTVNAIEENVARVEREDGEMVTMPLWLLPADVTEGEVLRVRTLRDGSRASFQAERDPDATRAAYARSAQQLRDMPVSDSRGDLAL